MSIFAEKHQKDNIQPNSRTSKIANALLVVSLFAALTSFGFLTVSKYVTVSQMTSVVDAEDFYFTSDYLTEKNPTISVYTGAVDIAIRDHDGAGNQTVLDLAYEIGTNKGTLTDKSDGTEYISNKNADKIFPQDTGEGTHTFTLIGSEGDTITVTAFSKSPYAKTISATFVFKSIGDSSFYTLKDHGYYDVLDIYVGADDIESLTVNYGAKLVPDSTNPLMSNWKNAESGMLKDLAANSHYQLVFFEDSLYDFTQVSEHKIESGDIITIE